MISTDPIIEFLYERQNIMCDALEKSGGGKFLRDYWQYHKGRGGGRTFVLSDSEHLDQAGVNVSVISGDALPKAATNLRPELLGASFQAMGLSSVIHPRNPYVPTVHTNVRFMVTYPPGKSPIWWFGGGSDLTPYYGFVEDCVHWHQTIFEACQPFGKEVYPKFKKQCDDYFYLPHRNEPRGIGGIFFDDLSEWGFERCFEFIQSVNQQVLFGYLPILDKRKHDVYAEEQRQFQLYRRGRYVEFNLLYDRGTLFGLQSGGRTESILMSLPPNVHWAYQYQPEKDSEEARLTDYFLQPKDWLAFNQEISQTA